MTDGSVDTYTAFLCTEDQATHQVELDPNLDRHLRVYLTWCACSSILSFDCIQLDWRIGAGVWTGIHIAVLKLFSEKRQSVLKTPAIVWFLTACAADSLISATLVIHLVCYQLF